MTVRLNDELRKILLKNYLWSKDLAFLDVQKQIIWKTLKSESGGECRHKMDRYGKKRDSVGKQRRKNDYNALTIGKPTGYIYNVHICIKLNWNCPTWNVIEHDKRKNKGQ